VQRKENKIWKKGMALMIVECFKERSKSHEYPSIVQSNWENFVLHGRILKLSFRTHPASLVYVNHVDHTEDTAERVQVVAGSECIPIRTGSDVQLFQAIFELSTLSAIYKELTEEKAFY